ncbi:hypothetical protein [Paucibacter sp. XJ19-41]|nr:hypothetical protein [Paucibacter sp. XJ19-41]MDC6169612.1 hypothetical protein [Paucibacter sp. XJ19-41]
MSTPTVPDKAAVASAALAQLFRHSLRDGRVHPLLHLVRRYRQESAR